MEIADRTSTRRGRYMLEEACCYMLDRDYYFHLSFENSLCKDYITEIFFNAMKRNVIHIALVGTINDRNSSDYIKGVGAAIYSFINAMEYSNLKNNS